MWCADRRNTACFRRACVPAAASGPAYSGAVVCPFVSPNGADAVVDILNHNHHTGIPGIANTGWLPDRYGLVSCRGRVVVLMPALLAVLQGGHEPPGRHLVFSATIGLSAAFSRARGGTPGQ